MAVIRILRWALIIFVKLRFPPGLSLAHVLETSKPSRAILSVNQLRDHSQIDQYIQSPSQLTSLPPPSQPN